MLVQLHCLDMNLLPRKSEFLHLTLVLLNLDMPCLANNVDPDQLASEEEAN